MFFSIAWCQGRDFQDHGSENAQTMVPDHGFARVGTMQVQAIMPPSMEPRPFSEKRVATVEVDTFVSSTGPNFIHPHPPNPGGVYKRGFKT